MAIVSDIEIRLRADIAQLRNDMRRAQGEVAGSVDKIRKSLLTLAAGFGLAEIVNQIIQAQREFDKLNSSLITATGSTKAAGEAMKALQDFAAKTPFSLQQVTEGFLKLRNLGLTPSERALESYGNTSAAMGKDLMQLVEAVADATTGEFERLKEFGIKAKQQGDKVSLTFQGTTTKIGNNAAEIEEYLTRIGEVNFAGGMARQADTLDGSISALGDTWSQTLVAFSQSGFGDVVRAGVVALSNSLQDLTAIFKALTVDATEEGKKVDELNGVHFILTTTFEALTVVGLNLAFAFRAIGSNVGAVAAAIANPTQALSILQNRFTDLGKEWDKVNFDSDRVLKAAANARAERAKQESKEQGDRLAQYKIVSKEKKSASDADVKAAAKALQTYKELEYSVLARVQSTERELQGLAKLSAAEEFSLDLTEKLSLGKMKLTSAQEARIRSLNQEAGANLILAASNKEYEDLQKKIIDNAKDLSDERYKLIDSAKDEAEQNEFAIKTFGMTEAAIIRLTASRLMDQEVQRLGRQLTEEEIADLNRVIALKERSATAVANRAELEAAKTFWGDIEKTARDTFVSIADGGKNAFQRLKDAAKNVFFDWLYQMTLKKWIISIGTQASGTDLSTMLGGGSGGSTGGSAGGISLEKVFTAFKAGGSLEKSIAESVQKGFEKAGLSGGEGTPGQAAQWAGKLGSTIGGYMAGSTLNKAISNGYETGSGFMKAEKLATAVGSYINPVLGAAIGAISGVVNRAFGMRAKEFGPTTLNGSIGSGGFSGTMDASWTQKGGWFRSDKKGTQSTAVDAAVSQSLNEAYGAIQASSAVFASMLGKNADSIISRTQSISIALGKDEAANQKAISEFFSGVADTIAREILPNIDEFRVEGEAAAVTLQRVTINFAGIDAVLGQMGLTSQQAFGAVGTASIAARERLIAFAGGLDSLSQQTSYFNENFIDEGKRVDIIQQELAVSLYKLGYSASTSADQYRDAVKGLAESGALATEAGARTYAGLLALAPAFRTVTDYINEINEAARQTLRDRAGSAIDALSRSVDIQKDQVSKAFTEMMEALEMGIDGANNSIERTSELSRTLRDSRIRVESESQIAGSRQSAQAQIGAAIAIAKASGVLPSVDDLRDALSTLNQDASGQFSSLADYQREVARTNNQLSELGGMTDEQLGIAERQLKALQDQKTAVEAANDLELARLDGLVSAAQSQLSAIENGRVATLSVADAVYQVDATLRELNYNVNGSNYTAPPVFYAPQPEASTMSSNEAMLAEMRTMNARLASAEAISQQTAQATQQFANQFNQVSGGGNSLVVENAQ